MRSLYISLLSVVFTSLFISSCSRKVEDFETEQLSDYTNLVVGKYITYRLDSLVYTNFGRAEEIHSYQVKHVIDAQITDALGRASFRVYRYIRDSAGTQSWQPNGTYLITLLNDQLEVIEDNLRFIKLHLPMKEGFSWKGNKYFPDNTYDYFSPLNSYDADIQQWDYYYDRFESLVSHRNQTYSDVWTIEEFDEVINIPVTDPTLYGSRIRAVEKYSKNIGLVYREYELWEYQPNTTGTGGPYRTGFGITMWMIDHN
jgi:hypothetical protein